MTDTHTSLVTAALNAIGMFFRVLRGHSYLADGYSLEVTKTDYEKARAGYDFLCRHAQGRPWQSIETAPKDGAKIRVLYEDGSEEDGVYWQTETRCCILGSRAGSYPDGWTSTLSGNLPVEGITHWRPMTASALPSTPSPAQCAPDAIRHEIETLRQLAENERQAGHNESTWQLIRIIASRLEAALASATSAPAPTLTMIAAKAREWAGHYDPHSDGRNTFVMFAEWVEGLSVTSSPSAPGGQWQSIETAPKDGTKIWGWLYDSGIVLMHWMTAEQNAAADGSDEPDDYIACWVKSGDPDDGDWSPKFWLPFDSVGVPPGIAWVGRRWRDTASAVTSTSSAPGRQQAVKLDPLPTDRYAVDDPWSRPAARYIWPAGCHSPNSCHRNGRCMYVGCKHDGTDAMVTAVTSPSGGEA